MANVDENISRFINAQQKAKKLIQMDSNGSLDNVMRSVKESGKIGYDEDGFATTNIMEHSSQKNFNDYNISQLPQSTLNTKKLPKEIIESFKTKQIDTSLLGGGHGSTSVLDQIGLTQKQVVEQPQQKQHVISESAQQPMMSQNVDYSMIKMIVEECVRKYTTALKKQILSESKSSQESGTLQAMKIGNKFTFIDSSGNLYEATLKKVKNIND